MTWEIWPTLIRVRNTSDSDVGMWRSFIGLSARLEKGKSQRKVQAIFGGSTLIDHRNSQWRLPVMYVPLPYESAEAT